MARTPTTSNAATSRHRSQSVRVTPLGSHRAGGRGWSVFGLLAARYVDVLKRHHPWPPAPRQLVAAALAPEISTYLVERNGRTVGFTMAEPRDVGTGAPVMWISHFHCPGDLGAARALLAAVERSARAHGYRWVAFETVVPGMKRHVALGGFRPMATVYGKEVKHG